MKTATKLAREKRAAKKVAEILYASLRQFPEKEQERRMREIRKIAVKAGAKVGVNIGFDRGMERP